MKDFKKLDVWRHLDVSCVWFIITKVTWVPHLPDNNLSPYINVIIQRSDSSFSSIMNNPWGWYFVGNLADPKMNTDWINQKTWDLLEESR